MAEEKKISLIEYRLFELCKNVLDGYQKKLEGYEREVKHLNVPVLWADYQIDRDCLHNSIMGLQLLLGLDCLPQKYPAPRTLEAALRYLGVDKREINSDIKSCENCLQRANELKESSLELGEHVREVTCDVLKEKRRRGEMLTTEEKNVLERFYDILSDDH